MESVPSSWENPKEHRRKMAMAVNQLMNGQTNACLDVTLTPSETTTVVTDERITPSSALILIPLTAQAADALVWVYQEATVGSITIQHNSDVSATRNFIGVLVGR